MSITLAHFNQVCDVTDWSRYDTYIYSFFCVVISNISLIDKTNYDQTRDKIRAITGMTSKETPISFHVHTGQDQIVILTSIFHWLTEVSWVTSHDFQVSQVGSSWLPIQVSPTNSIWCHIGWPHLTCMAPGTHPWLLSSIRVYYASVQNGLKT